MCRGIYDPHSVLANIGSYRNTVEIFDDMGLRIPKAKNSEKMELFGPRFNFGAKQMSELQNFVLKGHPNLDIWYVG